MSTSREKSIFLEALDCPSNDQRAELLARRCGDDSRLRRSVEALLQAHDQSHPLDETLAAQQLLQRQMEQLVDGWPGSQAANGRDDWAGRSLNRSGQLVGRYRLMELLGEGGFGQVYVGQQRQPVRRLVAVKLLKPGMDTREVLARFEAERQALAMMNHPHIAQVYEAGATELGQPYLVMELVRGQPITSFCRQQRLPLRERLRLMVDVCHAVHHAHQKGIIHRDLKPSNVLVALDDVAPIVKVIDFGIAKAIGQPLTDKTLYTMFTQLIGTPMYMSPEQAEMKARDIDTLTDIYALGVILYELLTENTPFDKARLQTASLDELRQMIRDEQPPRPSARLSKIGLQADSARWATDLIAPAQELARQLRGDLDWIVLKAMDKDRRRRYETAAELARDITRYLEGQPVLARPPSAAYRMSRFARRNRWIVVASSLILLSMLVGTLVSLGQAIRATRAQAEAERLQTEAVESVARLKEANILLDNARANADQQLWSPALDQYSHAIQLQPEHYLAWAGRGGLYVRLAAWQLAAHDFAKAIELGAPANNPGWWGVPQLFAVVGDQTALRQIVAALRSQVDNGNDAGRVLMAIRGICQQPLERADALKLLARVDALEQSTDRGPGPRRFPPTGPEPPDDLARRRPPGRIRFDGIGRPDGPGGPGAPGIPRGPGGLPPDVADDLLLYVRCLAAHRAGECPQVIEWLQSPRAVEPSGGPLLRSALLAAAFAELGQQEPAERYLQEAQREFQRWFEALQDGRSRMPWFDGLEGAALLSEAHQKLHAAPYPLDALFSWHDSALD